MAAGNPFAGFAFGASPSSTRQPLQQQQQPQQQREARSPAVTSTHSTPPRARSNSTRQRSRSRQPSPPPPAAAAAAAGGGGAGGSAKRQRAGSAALSGPPRGLGPKLGPGKPLRLLLVGHNPSEHAFHTGHFYSNPSNRMWPLLIATGIAPPGSTGPEADDGMPEAVGVGFIDVGSGEPGTDSKLFTADDFARWRAGFYDRLLDHMRAASAAIGCRCGSCGAPALVAFTGKRQFLELLNLDGAGQQLRGKAKVAGSAVALGPQPGTQLPPGWPLPADRCEVWVLTSTSGAAPMSNADRERPYQQLAQRLAGVPWPRDDITLACSSGKKGPSKG